MFQSLLIVVAIAVFLYGVKRWNSFPSEKRKESAIKLILWSSAAVVILLVLAGRAHWLMGVLAALMALASRAVQLAQYVPVFKRIFEEANAGANDGQKNGQYNSRAKADATMSKRDAAEILGVDENCNPEEIKAAHKRLIQKLHPDRGGSDALARQINAAKDVLLA